MRSISADEDGILVLRGLGTLPTDVLGWSLLGVPAIQIHPIAWHRTRLKHPNQGLEAVSKVLRQLKRLAI